MKNGAADGHRMNGSAHLFILCPQNTGFRGKTGHRMDAEADPFILWHKNESARAFMSQHEPARARKSPQEPS